MVRVLLVSVALGLLASAAHASCALDPAKPDTLRAAGTLTLSVFPGPPNFENVRKGDAPEPTFILQLAQPICASNMEGVDEGKHDVSASTIHLVAESPAVTAGLQRLRGKRIKVQGTSLVAAHTGHHHAPLLLWVKTVAAE